MVTSYPFPSFQADSLLGIEHTFDTLLRMKNQVRIVYQGNQEVGLLVWIIKGLCLMSAGRTGGHLLPQLRLQVRDVISNILALL